MWRKRFGLRFWAGVTGGVILVLGLLVWLYPSSADFDPYNPFWNGLQNLARDLHAPLISGAELQRLHKNTALLVIPYRKFSEEEMLGLKSYTQRGGNLILADDFGYGNSLLSFLGIAAEFQGRPLLDPLFNYRNSYFPKISFPGLGREVVLDHPTALSLGPEGKVLALSSSFSFLDLDDNGNWDPGEPQGPFVMAASLDLGRGKVILLSDPSFLINSMLDVGQNRAFLNRLVGGLRLYIFSPIAPPGPLYYLKQALYKLRTALQSDYATIIIPATVIILAAIPLELLRRRYGRGTA